MEPEGTPLPCPVLLEADIALAQKIQTIRPTDFLSWHCRQYRLSGGYARADYTWLAKAVPALSWYCIVVYAKRVSHESAGVGADGRHSVIEPHCRTVHRSIWSRPPPPPPPPPPRYLRPGSPRRASVQHEVVVAVSPWELCGLCAAVCVTSHVWDDVGPAVTSRHVTSRHVTSRHVTSRHVTSRHVWSFCQAQEVVGIVRRKGFSTVLTFSHYHHWLSLERVCCCYVVVMGQKPYLPSRIQLALILLCRWCPSSVVIKLWWRVQYPLLTANGPWVSIWMPIRL